MQNILCTPPMSVNNVAASQFLDEYGVFDRRSVDTHECDDHVDKLVSAARGLASPLLVIIGTLRQPLQLRGSTSNDVARLLSCTGARFHVDAHRLAMPTTDRRLLAMLGATEDGQQEPSTTWLTNFGSDDVVLKINFEACPNGLRFCLKSKDDLAVSAKTAPRSVSLLSRRYVGPCCSTQANMRGSQQALVKT